MNPPTCSHREADVNKMEAVVKQIAVVTFVLCSEKKTKAEETNRRSLIFVQSSARPGGENLIYVNSGMLAEGSLKGEIVYRYCSWMSLSLAIVSLFVINTQSDDGCDNYKLQVSSLCSCSKVVANYSRSHMSFIT